MAETSSVTSSIPKIGDRAPDFQANSSKGPLSLKDYKGKWVILFSHPADFTPVCTTEFIEFAKRYDEFEKRNAQLIGLSIDSVYSHIAWLLQMEKIYGVEVKFPVIADLNMNVANLYGLIHERASATSTVRAVFFIDPEGVVRALIYYPASTGRNIDEILRVLDSLTYADSFMIATPANWNAGDDVIVPQPATLQAAKERLKDKNLNVKDWFLAIKKSPK
ncbi:MAG: peroxiredoxin [Candidatus Thermoplasmatota archaeon]|jgi:peroxiredoxin (alkyl hydroperoxide reductase subunit C)|nr:peroxiredoxin [Candidatus Thermoplasmatota archaeon]MCL5790161.1 peroxiredoxin [Candidatus Thermoplasmatota archaeon]